MRQTSITIISFFLFSVLMAQNNQWTWIKGENRTPPFGSYNGLYGIYGTKGIPDAANTPGARLSGMSWCDKYGNFWIMGGTGYSAYDQGYMNDLWKFSVLTGQWTWVWGENYSGSPGYYGSKGVMSVNNQPPAKAYATCWTDKSGDVWLFGGGGPLIGSGGFNDLWKYSVSTNQWVWKSGDNVSSQPAIFGVKGIPSVNNKPSARHSAAGWTDNSGNLWLFGGNVVLAGKSYVMNDLWKYSPSTDEWTWMSGDKTTESSGIYGVKGTADINNKPGARYQVATWTDGSGNLWMFGGYGYASAGSGNLSDLWKYTISTGKWTWVNGSKSAADYSVYTTKGLPDSSGHPGGRETPVSWTDATGAMWLFGGNGYATDGPAGYLNDLWKYSVSNDQWTWISGDKITSQPGIYNTKGVADPSNTPGSRQYAVGGTDLSGNLWLFGGAGYSVTGISFLNDLWKFSATDAVLPVEYVSFKGEQKNKTIFLAWITAQELNNKHFVIQRSYQNAVYDSIGHVLAAGNTSSKSSYSFTDSHPLQGDNYYRLKQVDKNGRSLFSKIVKITIPAFTSRISVIQNPVKDKLQVQLELPVPSKLTIQISDNNGHLVFREEYNAVQAHSVILIPANRLTAGKYFINVRTKDETITTTFIKM